MSVSMKPDSGWSWVILLGCSVNQFVMSLVYCMGIFNVVFLDVFQQSKQVTAWLGSIVNIYLILAPLSGYLTSKIGARTTCMLGALISATGYFLTFFATEFWHVVVCFGFMPGVGLGLCYIPSIVPVGDNFNKYRNMAFGMCSCAVGIGSMVWPALIYLLEGQFGWRGCLLIVAGVFLHVLVSGAVIRPADKPAPPPLPPTYLESEDDEHKGRLAEFDIIPEETSNSLSKSRHSSSEGSLHSNSNSISKSGRTSDIGCSLDHEMATPFTKGHVHEKLLLSREYSNSFLSVSPGFHYNSDFNIHTLHHEHTSNLRNTKRMTLGLSNTLSASGYLAASMVTLHSTGQLTSIAEVTMDTPQRNKPPLFRDKVFYLMCVSACLLSGAHFMFYMHFPAFCVQKGLSSSSITTIMTLVGGAAVVSRLSCGFVANIRAHNVLLMYTTFSGLAGATIILCPLLPGHPALLASAAVLYSISANAYCILMAPLTIELFSLETLAMAYGAESCICGIGSLLAPPFAGSLWLVGAATIIAIPFIKSRDTNGASSTKLEVVDEKIVDCKVETNKSVVVDNFARSTPIKIVGGRHENEAPIGLPSSAPEGSTWTHERVVGRA